MPMAPSFAPGCDAPPRRTPGPRGVHVADVPCRLGVVHRVAIGLLHRDIDVLADAVVHAARIERDHRADGRLEVDLGEGLGAVVRTGPCSAVAVEVHAAAHGRRRRCRVASNSTVGARSGRSW